jgi:hypothetical protein
MGERMTSLWKRREERERERRSAIDRLDLRLCGARLRL